MKTLLIITALFISMSGFGQWNHDRLDGPMIYVVNWCIMVVVPCENADIYDKYGRYQYTTSQCCWEQKCGERKVFSDKDSAMSFINNANDLWGVDNFSLDSMTIQEFLSDNTRCYEIINNLAQKETERIIAEAKRKLGLKEE